MCGFVGIIGPSYHKLKENIPSGLTSIQHRGPDTSLFWESDDYEIAVGHCRLSIVDLSPKANQPFVRDNNILIYNGEVYNHTQLRKHTKLNYNYLTHSDTETLFALLSSENDLAFFNELIGMFAGSYIDLNNQKAILFRDSLGIKPLYYLNLPDSSYIFASEIRAIHAIYSNASKLNRSVLASYLLFENYRNDLSWFQDIKLLKPGEIIELNFKDKNKINATSKNYIRYQKPTFHINNLDEAIHFTRNTVIENIKLHLMSDVPIGCYLSGGVDSSIVTMVASQYQSDLQAFHGYFDTKDNWYNEKNLAEIVAKRYNVSLHSLQITPKHFIEEFDRLIYTLEEPRMGMGSFSQYIVAKEVAKSRRVILSGHGGDELFFGYSFFKIYHLLQSLFSKNILSNIKNLSIKEWPLLLYTLYNKATTNRYFFAPKLFSSIPAELKLSNEHIDELFSSHIAKIENLVSYYRDVYLQGLLAVEDKISMSFSLETRMPLWSQQIISAISQLPREFFIQNGEPKYLLKNAFLNDLPNEILTAPKRGFPTPLRLWFRNELFSEICYRLLSRSSLLHELYSKREIKKLLLSHKKGSISFVYDERRAHKIWMLLCLEAWFRLFNITNL